jgi:RimJ/RimL family protein N-acetyltransferase
MSNGFLVIRNLNIEDASLLSAMLLEQHDEYMQYFIPFSFDPANIRAILERAKRDVYMGIFWADKLAGFFMLRGWDDGYEIPAYGVTIAQSFSGYGLGKLSLEVSKSVCQLRGAKRLMLKVHPQNSRAKQLYEAAGFVQSGIDERIHNLVYHYDFRISQEE